MKPKLNAIFLDLDGTIYVKDEPIPGAASALSELRKQNLQIRFLTNTDSKRTCSISSRLCQMGFDIAEYEIFTPYTALQEFLRLSPNKRCYYLVSKELEKEIAKTPSNNQPVDYVVIGDCRDSFDYITLNAAFRHLMAGADAIALQKGRDFVSKDGYSLDTGAIVAMFEYASGKIARVMGKPSPDFFSLALSAIGCSFEEAVVVGDDITTDIAGAKAIGSMSILVKTGKFTAEALADSSIQPDAVVNSITDVPSLLKHWGC